MKIDAFTLHPVLDALAWTLIHSLWQAGIVALVVALLFDLTKSLSARLRYHIAVTGLEGKRISGRIAAGLISMALSGPNHFRFRVEADRGYPDSVFESGTDGKKKPGR